jgi:hypothetical protein
MRSAAVLATVLLNLLMLLPHESKAQDVATPCVDDGSPEVIDFGDIITCVISPVGDSDTFEFEGTAGDTITLTILDLVTGFSPYARVQLFDPDEVLIDTLGANESGVIRQFELEKTGTYTAFVTEAANNQTTNYSLALQTLFPPPAEAQTLEIGVVVEDSISPATDSDVFLFEGTSGDTITLTILDRVTGFSPYARVQLFDPDEVLIDTLGTNDTGVIHQLELVKTGTYTAFVTEAANNQTLPSA